MSSSQGTELQTDGHRDSMTESTQWADSVKILKISTIQEQELFKYMLESDDDNSGTLDFEEFKVPPGRISGYLS